MLHTTVNIDLGERSYPICIGTQIFGSLIPLINSLTSQHASVFIVTDKNVAALYLEALCQTLSNIGLQIHRCILPAGESSKSFQTLEYLIDSILIHRPERKCLIIALGGGVIGDLTGFAASVLLRGVPFIQIPTTLLAQVDSSVGGKTGINTRYGKNLVGSFYQPKLVIIDTKVLATLPKRHLIAGYAEVAKYGLITKPEFFTWLEQHGHRLHKDDPEFLQEIIKQSCQSKAEIVAEDEHEHSGKRALLNLGHTFGHALEAETGYSETLFHGEAVAIGIILAFQLSVLLDLCPQNDLERVKHHFRNMGLPTSLKDISQELSPERLLELMYFDKKIQNGKLVFTLVKGIGNAFIAKDVDPNKVLQALKLEC